MLVFALHKNSSANAKSEKENIFKNKQILHTLKINTNLFQFSTFSLKAQKLKSSHSRQRQRTTKTKTRKIMVKTHIKHTHAKNYFISGLFFPHHFVTHFSVFSLHACLMIVFIFQHGFWVFLKKSFIFAVIFPKNFTERILHIFSPKNQIFPYF